MAYSGPAEDVEWVDVEDDAEWDLLHDGGEDADDTADVIVTLDGESGVKKRKVARRPVTKQDRQEALFSHRSHTLCLLARAYLMDVAADGPELQALMLSQLDPNLIWTESHGSSITRGAAALLALLSWFASTFSLTAAVPPEDLYGRGVCTLQQQVCHAARLHAGPAECLVALFVALLRAQGVLARVVRLCDSMSLRPWSMYKAPNAAVHMSDAASAASAPAMAAASSSSLFGSGVGGGRASLLSQSGSRSQGCQRGKGTNGDSDSSSDSDAAGAAAAAVAATAQKPLSRESGSVKQVGRSGRRGSAGKGHSGAADIHRRTRRCKADAGDVRGGPQGNASPPKVPEKKHNRGDDELERNLQMAMMATQATATAKPGTAGTRQELKAPKLPAYSPAVHKLVRQSLGASSAVTGQVLSLREGRVPFCWAEVYCGSAEAGRWLHVDVVNGLVDKPETVERGSVRSSPVPYVAAAINGAIKDVTSRYVANLLVSNNFRDEGWWRQTMLNLQHGTGLHPGHTPRAHLPHMVKIIGAAPCISPSGPGKLPGSATAERERSTGPTAASDGGLGGAPLPAGCSGASRAANGRGAVVAVGGLVAQPPPAAAATTAIRITREDEELRRREEAHLVEKPTNLEGWKKHPLYVLKRHIGKYQALAPSTHLLGMFRGEPYFDRRRLSDLHTAERWRQEGRRVRDDEREKPAKQVAKRKVPGAARQDGGGSGGSGQKATSGGAVGDAEEGGVEEVEAGNDGPDAGAATPMSMLYGRWQTEEYVLKASGGRVPKNEHGNCEVPPFCKAVPVGTVHLNYKGIGGLVRQMGLDFASALTGFERHSGRMLPKLEGIVVCKEIEERVMEAYWEREAKRNAAAIEKQRRAARSAWLTLLQAMRMRAQLKSQYEDAREADADAAQASGLVRMHAPSAAEAMRAHLEEQAAAAAADNSEPPADADVEEI